MEEKEKAINGIKYRLNEETLTAEVIQKKGYSGDIIIPEVVVSKKVSYKVVGIDTATFKESNITSITIPDGVTTIGENAFRYCESLTSITIPNSVTTIGKYAFYRCDSLPQMLVQEVEIDNLRFRLLMHNQCAMVIGSSSKNIESINNIPAKIDFNGVEYCVTTIGDEAFEDCKSLTSINIPDSVTTIGDEAFEHCDSLTSITLPDGVKTIGEEAFYGCSSLTSINIPDSVKTIGENAFQGCTSFTSIIVGKNNKVYDSRDNCNAIIETATSTLIKGCQNTIIPNGVTTITMIL